MDLAFAAVGVNKNYGATTAKVSTVSVLYIFLSRCISFDPDTSFFQKRVSAPQLLGAPVGFAAWS
jgi:hypothetical protein